MSDISKALQGGMKSRNGHIKDMPERQLDLFSSLSDRASTAPNRMKTKGPPVTPEPAQEEPPEVELILPPYSEPPDVSAEVRAVLSESGPAQPVESSTPGSRPPLRTGIYHRPQRPLTPLASPTQPMTPRSSGSPRALFRWLGGFFSGMELDRRMVSLVLLLIVVVALVAYWTARPRVPAEGAPGTLLDLSRVERVNSERAPAVPPSAPEAVVVAPVEEIPAADWNVKGTVATLQGTTIHVRFTDPIFVSSDKISLKGMNALKAVAKKLVSMKGGARVIVMGHTDDVLLSKPTAQFRNNAELAGLRAKVAVEHLGPFSRANKGLTFEAKTGAPSEAPYPNDTAHNRRLNRTITVQILPAP